MQLDALTEGVLNETCHAYSVDPDLVRAICQVESGGVSWRARYEPAWNYFYLPASYAAKLGITTETERIMQATSWGMGQVMGAVARELGFFDHLTKLALPETGIVYCIKKISELHRRYEMPNDLISAYNAGTVHHDAAGVYKNQKYVEKVLNALHAIKSGVK